MLNRQTSSRRPVALYARYSTDKQDARSIDDQCRNGRRAADRLNRPVARIFKDEAISGTHTDRPDFQRMMEEASTPGCTWGAVVVDEVSRLSRDLGDTWQTIFGHLAAYNIEVIDASSMKSSFDEDAWMYFGMNGLINQGFVQKVKIQTHRGMEGRALSGLSTGGRVYGYTSEAEPNPARPDKPGYIIKIDSMQAEIVRRIFGMFRSGIGLKQIAATLNNEGIEAPHDGGKKGRRGNKFGRGWLPSTIRYMLTNERYIGQLVWNKVKWVRVPGSKKRRKIARPREEWVIREMPELRIIDAETWEAVQGRFSVRAKGPARPAGVGQHGRLLSGLLKCGECGASIVVVTVTTKKENGARYVNYGCSAHNARGRAICKNSLRVSEKKLISALVDHVESLLTKHSLVDAVCDAFMKEAAALQKQDTSDADAQALVREAEQRVKNIASALARVGFSDALVEQLQAEEAKLKHARAALAAASKRETKVLPHPNLVRRALAELKRRNRPAKVAL